MAVTHGVYTGPAIERIAALDVMEVASTNTVFVSEEQDQAAGGKLAVLDVAPLFANAISQYPFRREREHAVRVSQENVSGPRVRGPLTLLRQALTSTPFQKASRSVISLAASLGCG